MCHARVGSFIAIVVVVVIVIVIVIVIVFIIVIISFHSFKMLISQARNKLFESFKSLKSSSGLGLCIRIVIRNLLSSTTPFGGHKDTPILDIVRGISKGRPVNESC